jgi:O-antigen ligase
LFGLQAYLLGAFVPILSTMNNYLHGVSAEKWELRFSATGVNAVDMSLYLLLAVPIAWHLFNHPPRNNRILKYINLAYLPLSVFAVLLTGSRTSLFAVIPAFIFIVWPKRLTAGRIIGMAVLLILSILIFRAVLPASIAARLSTVASSISSADIGGRVGLWAGAVDIFTQHPIIGSGAGTTSVLIGAYAHQTFLSVLAETGFIGFLLFCCVLLYVVSEISRLPKGYLGCWLATFLVWLVGILSLSFEFRKITWLFFTFMIMQAYNLREQWRAQEKDLKISEVEEVSTLGLTSDIQAFQAHPEEDTSIS